MIVLVSGFVDLFDFCGFLFAKGNNEPCAFQNGGEVPQEAHTRFQDEANQDWTTSSYCPLDSFGFNSGNVDLLASLFNCTLGHLGTTDLPLALTVMDFVKAS